MEANDLRSKSAEELAEDLLALRREQFNLRMQQATGELARPHEYRRVRKNIARVKTVLAEQARAKDAGSSE